MKRALLGLMLVAGLSAPALALTPPSAMSSGLPEAVTAESREAADYSLIVQADKWVSGPSFADKSIKWFLAATIVSIEKQGFGDALHTPFVAGGTILIKPYCSQGAEAVPGGPGSGCAAFVGRRIQIWGLLADMQARPLKPGDKRLLIQAENLLDAALLP